MKREPEILTADLKSNPPNASPNSTWSFTSKSYCLGVPQVKISTFSFSSLPIGADSCGKLGTLSEIVLICSVTKANSSFALSNASPSSFIASRNGLMSSPRFAA